MLRTTGRLARLVLASLAAALATVATAGAEQQQWAAAYVDWTFPTDTPGVALTQEIRVAEAATASFFTLNWDFVAGDGGYIGLQSDESGVGNVRFSLWNATAAQGEACRTFDGEGEGMTCVLPFTIAPDAIYRMRVTRGDADAAGQWWTGWIETRDGVRRRIGALRVKAILTEAAPASVHNFSEFWGDAVRACRDVPLSAAVFGPPALTAANGVEARAGTPTGRRPEGHPCRSGRERTGAVAGHTPMTVGGAPGMLLTLGGNAASNRALARRIATPSAQR